ncbi:hypothetical protein [Blastococcus sp. SYSU D00820]
MEPRLPGDLVLRRSLVAAGWSDDELARSRRARRLTRLRRGAYVTGELPTDVVERHRLLIRATLASLRRPAVLSHQSAAVLHDWTLWGVHLDRVHVTRQPPASSEVGTTLRSHVARLSEKDVVEVDGIPVTDPVRTALDLARSLPVEPAVVALDGALYRRALADDDLVARLPGIAGTRGSRSAARAVALADRRSESVGESRSRLVLLRAGLAPSTLQLPVHDPAGRFLGRADFAWEAERLLGEFDGRVKYGRLLRPGLSPGDAVFEEKLREDALREAGWGVVRWTWADIGRPGVLAERVRRGLLRRR